MRLKKSTFGACLSLFINEIETQASNITFLPLSTLTSALMVISFREIIKTLKSSLERFQINILVYWISLKLK